MPICWEEKLRVGIETLDEQHQEMFARFAILTEAITKGSCDRSICDILDYLNDYANIHFAEEKRLMPLYDYAGIEEQRQQHVTFKENITKLYEMVANDVPNKELAIRIDAALIRYTINHMRNLDGPLIDFIKKRRSAETSDP